MASRTFPSLNSSFGVTGTVCLLACWLPRFQLKYIKSLVDKALQCACFFWVVADLDLAKGKADRLHRVFGRTGVLDGRNQGVLHVDLVVVLLVVAHRLVVNDVNLL